MDLTELDKRIAAQKARLDLRPDVVKECPSSPNGQHDYTGMKYQSSSGRKICKHCRAVTEKPFDTLGISER